jgi:hypothetical protein
MARSRGLGDVYKRQAQDQEKLHHHLLLQRTKMILISEPMK